ncbi:P-II family nitrogen regulator [Magnetospirillum sp. 64-120]|uniref:P-II family nitrogen regulator n=1 Tax=Magnetospirillum sp. 64-120 TaxID=1895778 RepID=UPI00092BD09A|nr:P-II family nitrogen regulator [Magnetospirillum sp. 64-120]OJX70433.1 MAG: hypothetical protein BGO92_17795 [Magnetospirillum sp. 64-120]
MSADPAQWLIRCVVSGGATRPFLSKLAREMGVWDFFFTGSRSAVADHSRTRARVVQFIENEEFFIVVPDRRLAEVMEFCYVQLKIGSPGRGSLYVTPVERLSPFIPPLDHQD